MLNIESTFDAFLNRMRASYEEGTASYLELLMGAADLSDFVSKWDYVSALLNHDKTLIERLLDVRNIASDAEAFFEPTLGHTWIDPFKIQ